MFFQRETDGVKIKTKMLEDQTETIRKLKEVSHFQESMIGLLIAPARVHCFLLNLIFEPSHEIKT